MYPREGVMFSGPHEKYIFDEYQESVSPSLSKWIYKVVWCDDDKVIGAYQINF